MNVNADDLSVSNSDFTALDDSALLTWRAEARAELERLPPHSPGHAELAARYDWSTQELQSATWQDNDITLFPGESQNLTVTYDAADLTGATPVISVSGWNVPKMDITAPPNGDW
jgi:Ig-like domain-containing protein